MKILHLSTSDIEGGAARSAYRLHRGLRTIGLESQMLVRAKFSIDESAVSDKKFITRLGPFFNTLPLKYLYPNRDSQPFSPQWFPDGLASEVNRLNPDIIDLHWICNGFLKVETLTHFQKPLIWTLHDMWAFTGGCHYNQNCDKYKNSCGACPQLESNRDSDISRWIWKRKSKAWKDLNLTIVTPSQWLAQCASESSLFSQRPIKVIPYGLDTSTYKPMPKSVARDLLNLPQDRPLILFNSMSSKDTRKGFALLQQALQSLSHQQNDRQQMELMILGATQPNTPDNLGFKAHYLGRFGDDISIALVYNAADVFVAPSLQDNLPNTILEAMACGVPSVAFNIGGMPDMIDHESNGYLAQPFDIKDLAEGIVWVLKDSERYQKLSDQSRKKAEQEFPLDLQAYRYQSLFKEILSAM
ncbi:MAG: glycosyltransferase family 4 protein [Cyanobacteria bacterium J06592_8]